MRSRCEGGEALCPGENLVITWDADGDCADHVSIALLQDAAVCATLADATANDGRFSWEALACGSAEDGYRIRITDLGSSGTAESAGDFTIHPQGMVSMIYPAGGEYFRKVSLTR